MFESRSNTGYSEVFHGLLQSHKADASIVPYIRPLSFPCEVKFTPSRLQSVTVSTCIFVIRLEFVGFSKILCKC
jgi:hypothetical protein